MKRALVMLTLLVGTINSHAQILWKVSGNGIDKPSYILGTHHIASIDICDNIEGFNNAYANVEQVIGEVDTEKLNSAGTQMKMLSHMQMPKGQKLSSLYTEDQLKVIDEFVSSVLGVGIQSFNTYKPAMLSSTIQVIIATRVFPDFNAQKGIDSYMQTKAKKDKKTVKGLETIEFQINLLYNEPLEKQAADLLEMAQMGKEVEELILKLTESYHKQDIESLWEMTIEDTPEEDIEKLIYSRNRNWIKQMKDIMPDTPTMFVVGAGHLPGNEGLLELLKKEGYSLSPVW